MYKEVQKEEFISYYLRCRVIKENTLRTIFAFTETFEQEKGKDVSTFTKEEILDMLTAKKYRSVYSVQNAIVLLKHYAEYAKHSGKEAIANNNFKEITKLEMQNCLDTSKIKNILLTREDIDEIQNNMLNYTDKAILECLFCGISGPCLTDLTNLNVKSIDKKGNQLRLSNGKLVQISQKLCQLLKHAFDEVEVVSYGETRRVSKLTGVGNLYKEKANAYKEANEERKFRWVLRRVVIWREYFDIPVLTMKTISLSGLVYAINNGMATTNLGLRDYLKSDYGKQLASIWGFKAFDYANVIYEKVRWFIED